MKSFQNISVIVLYFVGFVFCEIREYYIGIKEIQWDYAPSGKNLILNKTIAEDEYAPTILENGDDRIGRVYKKAVYFQYTDNTFKEEMGKPGWLGYLGPVILAEEGDTVRVHLKNMATARGYTLHPHGLTYDKENEGALYPDNTEQQAKLGDYVGPGKTFSYVWNLTTDHAPTNDDVNCLTRVYHSHVNAPKDIASGLIGPLVICKKGTLDVFGDKVLDAMYALMFIVNDENLSWYLEDNIKTYCKKPNSVDREDEDFLESNKMFSINGYTYGNLPNLTMCIGHKTQWHLFGMGNEVDIHSAFFHGQILTERNHHTDTVSLFPASFVTAEIDPTYPGRWLLSCQVNDHLNGMQAFFDVKDCFPSVHKHKPHGEVRQYYIAAEEVIWDYGPSTKNVFTGKPLQSDEEAKIFFEVTEDRIGGKYKKVVYVEYTDDTFTKRKERTPEEEHLGILGPVIRAEIGDTISVKFLNNASRPYSIQPHGVEYTIDQDGTLYNSVIEETSRSKILLQRIKGTVEQPTPRPASYVRPGSSYTYTWVVPRSGGPTKDDADCITQLYFSAVDPVKDTSSGLVGPLLICKPNTLKSGKQKNAKEFHLLATVFDENLSWYLDENIKVFATSPSKVNKEDEDFQESNKMHSINGFMYGNLKGLKMCKGETVSWHLSGLGTETDLHGIYFNGNRFVHQGRRRDVVTLFPHISHTIIMNPDSIGTFGVVCKTTDHYQGGMKAQYTVDKCHWWDAKPDIYLLSKTYYIGAVEIEWDYSPNRTWEYEMHGTDSPGHAFIKKEDKFIGSKYKKVVYREYTDETFTQQKVRSADEEHLGILGPIIHADVGDKVKVVFKNMATRLYSIHAHGVKTDSDQIEATQPGTTYTYTWYIPRTAGPGEEDCLVGAYFSTADINKDLYSGLIGPLVICKRSLLRKIGIKKEVEEFALLFMVFDENESWYLDYNIKTYVQKADKVKKDDEEFIENNKMHAINGRIYGNLQGLTMHVGDKVYWYLMGMGNEVDMHTVHFHGHSFEYQLNGAHRHDVYELFPATFQTVSMQPLYPGSWLLHCHVTDHIVAGMETTYTVLEERGSKGVKGFIKDLFIKN